MGNTKSLDNGRDSPNEANLEDKLSQAVSGILFVLIWINFDLV